MLARLSVVPVRKTMEQRGFCHLLSLSHVCTVLLRSAIVSEAFFSSKTADCHVVQNDKRAENGASRRGCV